LGPRAPELDLPAASTAGDLLLREGLVTKGRRRSNKAKRGSGERQASGAPNDVWTIDFKGQFRTGDGSYCYPLTVMDELTRYLLGCQALPTTSLELSRRTMHKIFVEHGIPRIIRSDNGSPFVAANSVIGLTELGVWWIELGIKQQRIEPGHPEQNGIHERFHRTLKRDTARPPAGNIRAQQRRFAAFRQEYNFERPHEALDDAAPATQWKPSERSYPAKIAEPEYPAHWVVRKVDTCGHFKFQGRRIFLSHPLETKRIGMNEVEDGIWAIYFHQAELARLNERTGVVHA
jgi:transposase InsO family protein